MPWRGRALCGAAGKLPPACLPQAEPPCPRLPSPAAPQCRHVFGAYCSEAWRLDKRFFGTGAPRCWFVARPAALCRPRPCRCPACHPAMPSHFHHSSCRLPSQANVLCSSWSRAAPPGSGGGAAWPKSQTTTSNGPPQTPSQSAAPAGEHGRRGAAGDSDARRRRADACAATLALAGTRCGWMQTCATASPAAAPRLATTAWRRSQSLRWALWSCGGSAS